MFLRLGVLCERYVCALPCVNALDGVYGWMDDGCVQCDRAGGVSSFVFGPELRVVAEKWVYAFANANMGAHSFIDMATIVCVSKNATYTAGVSFPTVRLQTCNQIKFSYHGERIKVSHLIRYNDLFMISSTCNNLLEFVCL